MTTTHVCPTRRNEPDVTRLQRGEDLAVTLRETRLALHGATVSEPRRTFRHPLSRVITLTLPDERRPAAEVLIPMRGARSTSSTTWTPPQPPAPGCETWQ